MNGYENCEGCMYCLIMQNVETPTDVLIWLQKISSLLFSVIMKHNELFYCCAVGFITGASNPVFFEGPQPLWAGSWATGLTISVSGMRKREKYCVVFMVHNVICRSARDSVTLTCGLRLGNPLVDTSCFPSFIVEKQQIGRDYGNCSVVY